MIKIINIDNYIKKERIESPVTSPYYFLGKTRTYHPQGLFSEEIFGIEGSPERRDSKSWIELNCKLIHPEIYDTLSKFLFRKIPKLLNGDLSFRLNEDGILIEDKEGNISGFSSYIQNIKNIRYKVDEESENVTRKELVNLIYRKVIDESFFITRLFVISPEYRPIQFTDDPKEPPEIDKLNEIYRRIIMGSSQQKNLTGKLLDIYSYKMQMLLKELYEMMRVKISKKSGIIRDLMLGKRVDFSGRAVITPNPQINLGFIGVPLKTCCSIFEPFLIHGILNSAYSKTIPDSFHDSVRKFLGKGREEMEI